MYKFSKLEGCGSIIKLFLRFSNDVEMIFLLSLLVSDFQKSVLQCSIHQIDRVSFLHELRQYRHSNVDISPATTLASSAGPALHYAKTILVWPSGLILRVKR